MRMLATGSNCLPAGGIGAIAEQLASRIPADSIYTGDTAGGSSSCTAALMVWLLFSAVQHTVLLCIFLI
jgi:hypothetical protein